MRCIETTCRQACNKLKQKEPYEYDLNVYRGCQHGCKYCYALYSHEYFAGVKPGTFFKDIIVKTNIVDQLERQFASSSWKGRVVNIGSVTDSYQPIEAEYKLMPEILKMFIKFKNPCIISTKSKLILRDIDLIDKLSRVAHVNIACTITCSDESVRKHLEPGASTSAERFEVIKEIGKTKASRGVHLMPMVPFLTDTDENIAAIYEGASKAGADYLLPSFLNLKGPTRGTFFQFIKEVYPQYFESIVNLYQGDNAKMERAVYKSAVYQFIRKMQAEYNLYSNYMDFSGSKKDEDNFRQLTIF